MSVDKGFIYGRRTTDFGKSSHCPEIDLLIHDTSKYQPVYRTGEFVIVRPEAVLGIIQVKRNLTIAKLKEGLRNVIEAKQFIADVMPCHPFAMRGDIPEVEPTGFWRQPVFAAVIGFEGKLAKDTEFFKGLMSERQAQYEKYNLPNHAPTSCYVLPSYLGSLRGKFIVSDGFKPRSQGYTIFRSFHEGRKNIALQALLSAFFHYIGVKHAERPPFAYPHLQSLGYFSVSAPALQS